ncbi:MAG: thiamine phosphate synthase [Nitrospirota bacterium]|nr:MAG: thiamine phosphate synthase [Nitrospirota bacterium]
MARNAALRKVDFDVYLITDRKLVQEATFFRRVEDALKSGIRAIQLREKDLKVKELTAYAEEVRKLTDRYGAKLFINDRVDVAIAVGADGVHLGKESIGATYVRRISSDLVVGISTHSLGEALDAQEQGADFITFGPVYETPSKIKYGAPVGLDGLRDAADKINIPLFALGGIDPSNIKNVRDAGATGVAMISAIFASDNINESTKEIMRLMK